LPGYVDLSADDLPRAYDARPDDPTYLFVRGDDKNPDKSRIVDPGVLGFLKFADYAPQRVKLPVESYRPGLRPHVREAQLQNADKRLAESRAALTEAESQWNATKSRPAPADTKADSGKGTISETLPADTLIAFLKLNAADRNRSEAEEWSSAIKARLAADLAMRDESNSAAAETMSQKAAEAERRHALAASEAEIARLELQLAQADAKQNGQLSESLKKARAQRDESRKLVSEGKPGRHTPIAGAANAKTMFLSSTKFDPDPVFPPYSTGRRKALGDWITDERNPLTARVAVNHVWARHFGVPLVPTVFDFGRKGLPPSHPKLLDWLAAEFVESGWSMKRLHALIVESSTYRMSSSAKGLEENSKLDPDNRWLWRRTPVRVESQVVRDSVLSLAGTLETTMGGPPVPMTAQESSKRRSLYFFHSNNERNDFLTTFDEALVRDCYQRDRSIVPQQALALSNSKLVLDAAPAIARRIVADSKRAGNAAPDDAAFVDRAFLTLLGFRPSADELAACLDAIKSWRNGHPAEEAAEIGRTRLVWALINHNDFVTQR
jgi:hypothetical protein